MLNSIKKVARRCIYSFIWRTTKVNARQILFSSFSGKTYSDNPKPVSEKLHELAPDADIVWLNNGSLLKGLPAYARQVSKNDKIAFYRMMASSKVIVENFGFGDIPKKKGQYYIQTWHGDRTFNKVLYDYPFAGKLFVPESKPGFCDLAIAGSDFGERQYRSAFRYNGKVLKVGSPRNDILLNSTDAEVQCKRKEIGLDSDYKYLLYAPTLRRDNENNRTKQSIQGIDIHKTLSTLQEQYGGVWKCLLRAHPGIIGLTGFEANDGSVINVSDYPDMADLLLVADALITDYSSCAGDFALLRRPVFIFQDDIEEYLKKDRTFYFEMSESPYLIAHSQSELDSLIASTTAEAAANNCDAILAFYGTNETGHAAESVAKIIWEICNEI